MYHMYNMHASKLRMKFGNYALCVKFGYFVLRKIIKFDATRCRLRRLGQTGSRRLQRQNKMQYLYYDLPLSL